MHRLEISRKLRLRRLNNPEYYRAYVRKANEKKKLARLLGLSIVNNRHENNRHEKQSFENKKIIAAMKQGRVLGPGNKFTPRRSTIEVFQTMAQMGQLTV